MERGKLRGMQYVRLAPGAAEAVAPFLGVPADTIRELVLDVAVWPDRIRPVPLRGRNGALIAGDPVLLGASDAGLLFADGTVVPIPDLTGTVLVRWDEIRSLEVLGTQTESSTA